MHINVVAPQYGKALNQAKRERQRQHQHSDARSPRTMPTRDLKQNIGILEGMLRAAAAGTLCVRQKVITAMEGQLRIYRDELAARDLRDLARGKLPPMRSAFALGARVKVAA